MFQFLIPNKKLEMEISRRAMEVCEEIIAELGAEIHDDVIQRLTLLRFSLDRLEKSLAGHKETDQLLLSIKSEFQEVIESVRKTSRKLLSIEIEDNSFIQNIETLCQNLERPGVGNVHFNSNGIECRISMQAHKFLYRITQELIHNAFKHSSAWHVWVRLFWNNHELKIEVEDDGSDFSKLDEIIAGLRTKNNTLKMRTKIIQASIHYYRGEKGLIARVVYGYE